jgi:hypothetical protein
VYKVVVVKLLDITARSELEAQAFNASVAFRYTRINICVYVYVTNKIGFGVGCQAFAEFNSLPFCEFEGENGKKKIYI